MSPRTGRPPKGPAKRDKSIQLRMSEEELQLIDECSKRMQTSRTDVICIGVNLVKEQLDAELESDLNKA